MFREAMAQSTPVGVQAKAYYDRGELGPDFITVAMVMERMAQPDCRNGVLLDGFPRTLAQAEALDEQLAAQGKGVNQALNLSVPVEELLRRLSGRWLCRSCQAAYHEVSHPPRVQGRCDLCGGELYQRPDDTRETAERRLQVYLDQTLPLIDYYRHRGVLDEVDGDRDMEAVSRGILEAVRRRQEI
jgi:adenylate kinase